MGVSDESGIMISDERDFMPRYTEYATVAIGSVPKPVGRRKMDREIQKELRRLGFVVPSEQFRGFSLYRNGISIFVSPVMEAVTAALIRTNDYQSPRIYLKGEISVPSLELAVGEELEFISVNPVADERKFHPIFKSRIGHLFCIDSQDHNPDDPAVYVIDIGSGKIPKKAENLSVFLKKAFSKVEADWLLKNSKYHEKFDDISLFCAYRQRPDAENGDLFLNKAHIQSIRGIALFDKVKVVWLNDNQLTDIDEIRELRSLERIFLQGNCIDDISPLQFCTELETLILDANPIQDLSPLAGLKKLQTLSFNGTGVVDLSPLRDLPKLRIIERNDTRIDDIPGRVSKKCQAPGDP